VTKTKKKHTRAAIEQGGQAQVARKVKLLPQQQLFVDHYLICGIGKMAAAKAGYSGDCESYSSQLLKNPKVQRVLARERAKLAEKFSATKERVIEELCKVAYLDPAGLFDPDTGKLRPIHEIAPEIRAAIAGVNVSKVSSTKNGDNLETETTTKVKLWDKPRALEMLSKYLGLFADQPPVNNLQVMIYAPQSLTLEQIEQTFGSVDEHDSVVEIESQKRESEND
jgi:phage terminase small subunit